ncbi:putative short chain dehydrogenase [Leptospira wolbachii serovar Codice str. CDC]|uniref:Short chain dehydrogenase n=1 Tax=Leptospira wolbachii serovar Codice str. CDC TaxID=1218599 RepID=R9A6J2_9LEPT|nr:hypothetical protein [Leptospira wolbachii]EOQ97796.1 putative short chain dehydrogenase [Leptospira wolbachii serovar Codice str. CDC]
MIAAETILKLVNLEEPPLRLVLGSKVFDIALQTYNERIQTWKHWETLSRSAEKGIPAPEGYGH